LSQLYVWVLKTRLTPPLFFHWSACIMPGKWAVVYLCVRGIDYASFYDLSVIWNFSDMFEIVLFVIVCFFNVLHFKKFTVFFNLTYNNVYIFFLWIILTWFPWKSVAAKKISYWIRGWLWLIWNHHFYCLRHDLVNGIYVSQMTTDMIRLW
jgi:hypothetical protein